jgi:hypothetical protein
MSSSSSYMKCRALATAIIVFALAACGGGSDKKGILDPEEEEQQQQSCASVGIGTGSASVSGAVSANISGCSFFEESSSGDNFYVAVMHGGVNSPAYVVSIVHDGPRPAPGTYQLSETWDEGYFGGILSVSAGNRGFIFTSGSITISSSSGNSMSGTFSGTAQEYGTSNTVTVSGSFNAKCIPEAETIC